MDNKELLSKVEHTLLKPESTSEDIIRTISEASEWGCKGACIPPVFAEEALKYRETFAPDTLLVSVAGFPFGYHSDRVIWSEIRELASLGIDEIDVVGPTYLIKSGRWDETAKKIHLFREAADGVVLKLIMETGLLSEEELRRYCKIAADYGIDYAKTSSGYAGQGATAEAVRIMRDALPDTVKIKASGGIRSREEMLTLLDAGADVLGMSRAGEALGLGEEPES